MQLLPCAATLVCLLTTALPGQNLDWPGFRGPRHDGVAPDAKPPSTWSDEQNMRWRVELPGPGSSSPAVAAGKVYVASYSGYGSYLDNGGAKEKLIHHLSCYRQRDGELLWQVDVPGPLTEEARQIQITEHGFASPTPIVAGDRIFAYFGRAGVVAFDLDGKIVWRADLGQPSSDAAAATNQIVREGQVLSLKWGAAASPVLHGGLLFVNCSEESNSIRALDQATGETVWQYESANLEGTAVTPAIFGENDDAVLVIVLGGEIWGMVPATGEFLWRVATETGGGMSSMPIVDGDLAFVFGGDDVCYAVRHAPKLAAAAATPVGDGEAAADPRIAWTSKSVAIPSPVLYRGRLLAVRSNGFGLAIDPADGKVSYDQRLPGRTGGVYASPVVADGRLYVVSRKRGTFVYSADGAFTLIAHNELTDKSQFNASPALSGTQLLLRSDRFLYCLEHQ